ncbi:MAG: low molecular weight protein-tyrosine-phosphatase [Alistipes sp.]
MKIKVLFICLGNICRSPAAEEILSSLVYRRHCSADFEIDSAGTYGGHAGNLPDPRMCRIAEQRGYILLHRARQLREFDFYYFDYMIVMDDMNYEAVHRLAPSHELANKIYRMADFCMEHHHCTHIPDPYSEGDGAFERVLDLLEEGCRGLLKVLTDPVQN